MSRATYPQYRVSQWLDTSDAARQREQATIIYGVQIKTERYGKWMHVCAGSEPLFFESSEAASKACAELRAARAGGGNG